MAKAARRQRLSVKAGIRRGGGVAAKAAPEEKTIYQA